MIQEVEAQRSHLICLRSHSREIRGPNLIGSWMERPRKQEFPGSGSPLGSGRAAPYDPTPGSEDPGIRGPPLRLEDHGVRLVSMAKKNAPT